MKFRDYLLEVKEPPAMLKTNDEICNWLDKMELTGYLVARGHVDINRFVGLRSQKLTRIPVQFRHAKKGFDVAHNKLKSLLGSPTICDGNFMCQSNKLTTLEFVPSKIKGSMHCEDNNITSFEGISDLVQEIDGFVGADFHKIKSGGIGLMLIPGVKGFLMPNGTSLPDPFRIIEGYLQQPAKIFDCQNELIAAGFEEYAKL